MRAIVRAVIVAVLVGGCGASSSAPGATAAPAATSGGTAQASGSSLASAPLGADGAVLDEPTHGLRITFPAGWVVLTQSTASDAAGLGAIRGFLGAKASRVDDLVAALGQHHEYWAAAAEVATSNVATAQLRLVADSSTWATQQEAALRAAYSDLQVTQLTAPRPGAGFDFTNKGAKTRLYGFPRSGGVVIFTFISPTGQAIDAWDSIAATFTDAGR